MIKDKVASCGCGGCHDCHMRKTRSNRPRGTRAATLASMQEAIDAGERPPHTRFEEWARKRRAQW